MLNDLNIDGLNTGLRMNSKTIERIQSEEIMNVINTSDRIKEKNIGVK